MSGDKNTTDLKPEARNNPEPGAGIRSMQSTSLFRAVNFELFVKPNTWVMVFGCLAFVGSVGYIAYMNLTDDKSSKVYTAMNPDGTLTKRVRTSRWD